MPNVFKDRVSTYPNRYKVNTESGESYFATLERADAPTEPGTPLNAVTFNEMLGQIDSKTSMTLLWENASPTSSFEPQNIAVPTGAYEYTMVEGLNSLSWNGLAHAMGRIGHHATLNNGDNLRAFKVHDGYVEFFNGKNISTGAVSGDKMIPQKIWGIKGVIA